MYRRHDSAPAQEHGVQVMDPMLSLARNHTLIRRTSEMQILSKYFGFPAMDPLPPAPRA